MAALDCILNSCCNLRVPFCNQVLCLKNSFVVVQLPSHVHFCETPWIAAHQAFPSITISQFAQTHVYWVSDAIQPSHLLLPLLLPSIFPSIRIFSNEWTLLIKCPLKSRNSLVLSCGLDLSYSSVTSSSSCLLLVLLVFQLLHFTSLHCLSYFCFHHCYLVLFSCTSNITTAFMLSSRHCGLEINIEYYCTLYDTLHTHTHTHTHTIRHLKDLLGKKTMCVYIYIYIYIYIYTYIYTFIHISIYRERHTSWHWNKRVKSSNFS